MLTLALKMLLLAMPTLMLLVYDTNFNKSVSYTAKISTPRKK